MRLFRNATRGSVLHGTGFLIVIAGAAGASLTRWGLFGYRPAGPPLWCSAIVTSAGGVLFYLGPMLFGMSSVARPPERPDGAPRPLILYLRPFEVDVRIAAQLLLGGSSGIFVYFTTFAQEWWLLSLVPLVLNFTREQRLHDALVAFGDVLAFARPDTRLQPVGFARRRVGDDWQRELIGYLERASLVIVRPGATRSIRWEVRQVLEKVPPERILFDLRLRGSRARRQRTYDDFRAQVADVLGVRLPERLDAGRYLVIDSARRPHFIGETRDPVELTRHFLWGDFNRDRLAPTLEPIGIVLPPSPSDRLSRGMHRLTRYSVYFFAAIVVVMLGMIGLLWNVLLLKHLLGR